MNKKIPLSVCIITLNEERRLRQCLEQLRWAEEIVIVDSGSSDRTSAIAEEFAAKFHYRPFDDYASQREHSVSLAQCEWVLVVDADEQLSVELQESIREAFARGLPECAGFWLRRQNHYFGRAIAYGDLAPEMKLRLYRQKMGIWEGGIHEELRLQGEARTLRGELLHFPPVSVWQLMLRLRRYAYLVAEQRFARQENLPLWGVVLYPCSRFIGGFFCKHGYRDGWRGLVLAVLLGHYDFLMNVHLQRLLRKKASTQ